MPRRNKPAKHIPYRPVNREVNKVRYATKAAAESAADLRMLQNMSLELSVYQGSDGGWYLTSSSKE